MPGIEEVMTPTKSSATTNQTPRRSTRRQPDAISNGVPKNTPSVKDSEFTTTTQSLKSTGDNSLETVKNAKQIVKTLPSSREKRLEADTEESGSSLSDLDVSPNEEDSSPDLNQIQSQPKPGERSNPLVKGVKAVDEEALRAEVRKRRRIITEERVKVEGVIGAPQIHNPKTSSRKRKIEEEEKGEIFKEVEDIPAKPKQRKKVKSEEDIEEGEERPEKPTRKRKTKQDKESEIMPLAARTNGLKMFVGAHVSSAKGLSLMCFES